MSLQYLNAQSSGEHSDSVWKCSWTAKNEVVSASADGGLRVWDNSNPSRPSRQIQAHTLGITSLSIDELGRKALTVSVEGTLALTDLQSMKKLGKKQTFSEEIGEEGAILSAWSVSMHPSGSSYASTGQGARVGFYRISENEDDISMNGDGAMGGGSGGLSGECLKLMEVGKEKFGMDICYSPDGKNLALSTESGRIIVIDVETQAVIASHASHGLCSRTVSWSPDSQWLFSGSDDRRIVLHDVRAGSHSAGSGRGSAAVGELFGHTSWVLSVKASPDGRLLASGGADSAVKIWDVGQRACVSSTTTTAQVWSVDWQPLAANQANAGKAFISGGDDNKVTWWKAAGTA